MPKKSDKNVVMTRKQRIAASKRIEAETENKISTSNVNGIQYLPTPVKSKKDPNEYRALRLSNGLTVLLISQENAPLDNKQEPTASCTLSIDVGAFSDPPKMSGIAKLVVSVILQGSAKNPYTFLTNLMRRQVSEIELLGSSDVDRTTFFFQTTEKKFDAAIQIFSSCFVDFVVLPEMVEYASYKDPSENPMRFWKDGPTIDGDIFTDRELLLHVLGSGNDKHPGKYIQPGFKSNLNCVPKKKIFDETVKFIKRHYSAHRMNVLIKAPMSLDKLEHYAKKYFSGISNNGLPPPDFTSFLFDECFDTPNFQMIYQIPTSSDSDDHKLELNWAFPPIQTVYKCKPHKYISVWILFEGPGSLMCYLKQKGWCTKIACDIGENDYEDNVIYSIFHITLTLTDEGYRNRKDVIGILYSYITFLRCNGPQKRLFDKVKNSAAEKFSTWSERCQIACYVGIPRTMQMCSSTEYINGLLTYSEYDPELIKQCFALLVPEKAIIIIHDKNLSAKKPFSEKRKKFVYTVDKLTYRKTPIPTDWMQSWKMSEPIMVFSMHNWNQPK